MAHSWEDLEHQKNRNPRDCIDDSEDTVVPSPFSLRESIFSSIFAPPLKPYGWDDEQKNGGDDQACPKFAQVTESIGCEQEPSSTEDGDE